VKIGTETTQDVHDIRFERCEIRSSSRGLCIQARDEGSVYNIDFRDIKFVSRYHSDPWWGRGEAISLTAIPRGPQSKIGTIHDVRIQNVSGRAENSVRVQGSKESRIRGVTLENVAVTLDRWTQYPGGLFDNRPTTAYPGIEQHGNPGFSIRYADNVVLKHCERQVGRQAPGLLHARIGSRVRDRVGTHGFRRRGRASGAGRGRGGAVALFSKLLWRIVNLYRKCSGTMVERNIDAVKETTLTQ
jgi:hypothetical protein